MKHILHINNNTNLGGQQQVFLNILKKIDKEKYKIDLVVYDDSGPLTREIKSLGCTIYKVPSITKHPILHTKRLKEILSNTKYDVVHQHSSDAGILLNLIISKKMKVKKIILHSHASNSNHRFVHKVLRRYLSKFTNYKLACSDKAGEWMFKKDYILFPNGIDLKKYSYNENKRVSLRKKLSINNDTVVLGTIGRLDDNKNQKYMIDIYKKYNDINPNSILLIIGEGYNKQKLINYSNELKIGNKVLFLGNIDNPYDYYNIMDLFLLTSYNEGLPVVLVEAQANGLKCMISDSISRDSDITNTIIFESINEEPDIWATKISNLSLKRNDKKREIIKNGYSIDDTIIKLENIYND